MTGHHACPLCSLEFEGALCHSSCPMAKGCLMVRCPRCGYEFVEEGMVAGMVRALGRVLKRCAEVLDPR